MQKTSNRVLLALLLTVAFVVPNTAQRVHAAGNLTYSSNPPDTKNYHRKAVPADKNPKGKGTAATTAGSLTGNTALNPAAFVRDVVVSNTNPNLANGTTGGSEPSIAVNPNNPNEIDISAFTGSFSGGGNAPLWHSTDGGNTWSLDNSVTNPPGQNTGCPCDQSYDYDNSNTLFGTVLINDIFTGDTTDPTSTTAWQWPLDGSGNALPANQFAQNNGNADQPWLLVNKDPTNANQDDVYTAYDDFGGSPNERVAVSQGNTPPNTTHDVQVGTSGGNINPGLRLASDPRTGAEYALWQQSPGGGAGGSQNINYMLNRSTDGGTTWSLNGSSSGITVANADSTQPRPKFGTTNALLGGVDHVAVDPNLGFVYVVYGNRDSGTGNNRLSIARLQDDGTGNLNVVMTSFVTGQVQAALPSVAVAQNGAVGVLYDTFDGFSSVQDPTNLGHFFPIYTAHLAVSHDQGQTFNDTTLETFLSPATSTNPNDRQRVLGDYQEMKAVGNTFYGAFTGNGVPFGRTTATSDPIFFKASAGGPIIAVNGDLNFGTVARGTTATKTVTITDTGTDPLVVNGVSFTSGSDSVFSVKPNPGVPQTLQPSDSISYTVQYSPLAGSSGGSNFGTLQIQSSDPVNPTVNLAVSGTVGIPKAGISSTALTFASVAVDDRTNPHTSDQTLTITNQASCAGCVLNITGFTITGSNASDFSLVTPPAFPAPVAETSSLSLTARFDPSDGGVRTATLTISTDDPANPSFVVTLTGTGLLPGISAAPSPLIFGPTVYDPVCSPTCGSTQSEVITNPGQAELILDIINLTGDPAFSAPGPTSPLTRVPVSSSFNEPVTFHPTTTGRAITGTLTVGDTINGERPAITQSIPLCGEAVGRGIRVLVKDNHGNTVSKVDMLKLQSHGVTNPVNIQLKNLTLTTINPPTSCQQIQFHYENQGLQAVGTTSNRGAYYVLSITVGNKHYSNSFTLGVNEFKQITATVQ